MTIILRFFLFLFVLLNLALAGLVIAGLFQWQPALQAVETYFLQASYMSRSWWIGLITVCAWALICLLFLIPAFKPKKKPKKVKYINTTSSHGSIQVPMETVEDIAHRSAATKPGVRHVDVSCSRAGENVVTLNVTVSADERTNESYLSQEVEESIRHDVENYAEVTIKSLNLKVEGAEQSSQRSKQKVQ
ncbi:putative alkaline shock family protein YloU [Sinobaca qinghaiensis]|uniref:Putative alkaline shock family protein YloU n=1 Tax=Sinobaca qinghaiensis TaxID=342944 RepID=A0A419V4K4_9BACL|nr:alkaline shock response membrane anchor protein AmaP [Sinobaca qinghaiensis]RKD73371.1 putative alkaline shock family protein YloU [Sinobaca qinghaiensis]